MLLNVVYIVGIICVLVSANSVEKKCGENEEWVDKLDLCPSTCQSKNSKCVINSLVRPPGCQCKSGYKYLKGYYGSRRCIKSSLCPKCEKPHTEYNSCGSKCPLTCKYPYPRGCVKMCVHGCFCQNGYLLDETRDECVLPENCREKSIQQIHIRS